MARPIPDTYEIAGATFLGDLPIDIRAAADDQPAGFDGYIALWNVVDDRGTFFTPGSFKKTIKDRGASSPHLWNHDYWDGSPIGKHLSLVEDEKGVRAQIAVNEGVQRGAELMANLRFKVPIGLSFGFDRLADRTATDKDQLDLSVAPEWAKSAPRNELRAITEIRFWESSSVTFASNPKAKPDTVRSLNADTLQSLLADLRAGTLDSERRTLVEQLVAAFPETAVAGQNHDTEHPEARRNLDVEFAFAFNDWMNP